LSSDNKYASLTLVDKQKLIEDAWLGLDLKPGYEKDLFNPLLSVNIPEEFQANPHLYYIELMGMPEYFSFFCSEILNIEILPCQALFLEEMWHRKFPMFVASRGFGKAVGLDTPIRTKGGWTPIKKLNIGDKVYGSNGKLCNVTNVTYVQKDLNFYRVTFRDGRTIECCEDHMWKVWDKNKNKNTKHTVWSDVTTKDMVDNYFWVRKDSKSKIRGKTTKEYRFAIPINKSLLDEDEKAYDIHPYVLGVLLGDGSISRKDISFTSRDCEIVQRVQDLLPKGYNLSITNKEGCFYCIITSDKAVPTFWKLLDSLDLLGRGSHDKFIPESYKFGSHDQKLELIRGLMDTDGYANKSTIEYYTISNQLSDDFLCVARSLGLHCKRSVKESWCNGSRYENCNRISIYTKEPIFSLPRKLESYIDHPISKQGQSKYEKTFITNIEPIGQQDGMCITVDSDDHTYITKDYIVTHNSWSLALYAVLRAVFMPGRKIVITGAAFRQSKVIFEYIETIWMNAPKLRNMFSETRDGPRRDVDMCRFRFGQSLITALPIGDGSKIRGQRANDIIADEFASISQDIFENVIAGFAAVSAAPLQNVQASASAKMAKKLNIPIPVSDGLDKHKGNQIIISGTAYYDFNHFAEYWKKWKQFIESAGDPKKLSQFFNTEDGVPEDFHWDDYSIIRMPYELIPHGFMDAGQVARSRATIHSGIYEMEFGAVFSTDSNGFFKRSLIEQCSVSHHNEIYYNSCGDEPILFEAAMRGNPHRKYVYGIDPASEVDNFSIVVIELHPDHNRIVHCWTTMRSQHKEKIKAGYVTETNFYAYCARKIRDLMMVFPCEAIALDSQGGGFAVLEALHDKDKLKEGEVPIWESIDEEKEKDTDFNEGLHIVDLINFADAKWTVEANNGLRKDFEDRALLFPFFDSISLGLADLHDKQGNVFFDTLEDCVLDIENMKDELCTIIMTQTPQGRDKWDTPEVKLPGGKKGRLRKDRYSALIMANWSARTRRRAPEPFSMSDQLGGVANNISKDSNGPLYTGPAWFLSGLKGIPNP